MTKKKDVSPGKTDASGLRRSGREIPSRKQTTSSPVSSRKSERIVQQTSPVPSPLKDKLEKQVGSSPLRRSDRGKKSVETPDLPNIKSTRREKTTNNSKLSPEDITEIEDVGGGMKRKRFTAIRYKALFKPQRIIIESDDDEGREVEDESPQANTSKNEDVSKGPKSQDGIGVQEAPDKDHNAFLEGKVIDLDQIEDDDCPQTKSLDGKSNENSDNHVLPTSPDRIELDLENQNQQEPAACHKVTENSDVSGNMQNSKFVEFWVPVPISNVQLELYCANLLSKKTNLCASLKSDTHGALEEVFTANRKCCNHPFIVDGTTIEDKLQEGFRDRRSREGVPNLLDVGIKASGKFQFLDLVLPDIQKHKLRVLILFHFQPTNGTSSRSRPLGKILYDYVVLRYGIGSCEQLEGVGSISSKHQTAINTFNKDTSRFIFLLESRACHPSIKLSSVDIIIIFDSDINPSNDLKSLQKISIESQSEQIMIFRLYSSSTLEEKILKCAQNNVAIDIRSQTLRSNYDTLLTWGASDLFNKLTKFHSQPFPEISSGESSLKDAVNEFLYIISHKCKSNGPTSEVITQVKICGNYGKSNEVKTHAPYEDHANDYLFWKELLDGQSPVWKFVSNLTPRQRKRPSYFLDSPEGKSGTGEDSGGVRTRRRTGSAHFVSNTVEPAQLKTVTGGASEGDPAANGESSSPSGYRFSSTAVNSEASLLDQLKPTVSELCNVLKFSENVKDIVERFLEFVINNYSVSKEHTSALHALMISLCWTGSSLAKNTIDRGESFALAKKHFNFSCTEDEANKVYEKLIVAKELFSKSQGQHVPTPEGVKLGPKKSQQIPNSQESNENESMTGNEVFEKFKREWDQKRASLEDEYKMEKALILALYRKPSMERLERLKGLEREFAKNLEDHERLFEIALEDLKKEKAAEGQVAANPEVAPTLRENVTEPQGHDEPVCEGGNDIESTGSHTSEKEMVGATVSGEQQIGEVPTQQVDVDVAEKADLVETGEPEVGSSSQNAEGGITYPDVSHVVEDHNETGANDVVPGVDPGDMEAENVDLVGRGIPEKDSSNENAEVGTADVSRAVEDHTDSSANDTAPRVDAGDMEVDVAEKVDVVEKGILENDSSDENAKGDNADMSRVVEDHNETGVNGMAPCVDSGDVEVDVAEKVDLVEKGIPENDSSNENAEGCTADMSRVVDDYKETGTNDMAPSVDSGDMEVDVAEKVDLVEKGIPENDSSIEKAKGGTADVSCAVEDYNETGANEMMLHVDSADMEIPAGSDKENAEEGTVGLDTSHAVKDHHETVLDDVEPEVESAEMATPAGTYNKESPEEGEIYPDTPDVGDDHNETSPNEVTPHIESAAVATPAENDVLDASEAHNDSRGSDSSNSACAAISQDKTPPVQPVSSPPLDYSEPIIPEIQSEPLQEQLPNNGTRDEAINVGDLQPSDAIQPHQIILDVYVGNLQLSDASHPDQVIPDVNAANLQPSDLSQPDQIISDVNAGNLQSSDVRQPDQIMPDVNAGNLQLSDVGQLDQIMPDGNASNLRPSDASRPDQIMPDFNNLQPSDASQPDQIMPDVNDLQALDTSQLDQIIPDDEPDIPPSTDPTVAKNPTNTLEPACEEPQLGENLEENLPVSAVPTHEEHQPDPVTSVAPTPPVNPPNMFDNVINQVNLQMTNHTDPLQAEVDRLLIVKDNVAKCHQEMKQKLDSECEKEIEEIVAQIKAKYEGKQQETDAAYISKTMELEMSISQVTMNKFLAEAFRSKCQDVTPSAHPGRQQGVPGGLMQQLHRLSGSPSGRQFHGQSSGNQLPPQLQPQAQPRPRPPLQIVHQPAALFSNTPSRPPTPGTNSMQIRPPSSNSPSTPTRPPLVVNQTTSSPIVTTTRQPPGSSNMATPSPVPNRAPPSIGRIDMSATNQRINTETRAPATRMRPQVSHEQPRAPAPHIRNEPHASAPHIRNEPRASAPHIRNEPRAQAPHIRNEPRASAPHLRSATMGEIRAPAPHLRSFRSPPTDAGSHPRVSPRLHATSGPSHQPVILPVATSSPQSMAPRPPPPLSELYTVPPSSPPPSTQILQPIDGAYVTNSSSSAPDLVCLSDDD